MKLIAFIEIVIILFVIVQIAFKGNHVKERTAAARSGEAVAVQSGKGGK